MVYGVATFQWNTFTSVRYLDGWWGEAHEAGRKDRACICMLEGF